MRKKYLLIVIAAIIILAVLYLNRSYAHIYNKIGNIGLKPSDMSETYLIGNNNFTKSLTYVALGDSLTSGVGVDSYEKSYPYLIAKKFSEKGSNLISDGGVVGGGIILKDRSYPGAKTSDLKNNLLDKVIQDKPDVVTVLIGVNDIHGNVSKSEFKSNYEEILRRLTKETGAKIYVVNIPFIGGSDLLSFPYNFYFDWQTKQFNEVVKNLSETYKVNYVDLYSPTVDQFKKAGDHYSADSFHPSAKGYSEWAKIIYDGINQ